MLSNTLLSHYNPQHSQVGGRCKGNREVGVEGVGGPNGKTELSGGGGGGGQNRRAELSGGGGVRGQNRRAELTGGGEVEGQNRRTELSGGGGVLTEEVKRRLLDLAVGEKVRR